MSKKLEKTQLLHSRLAICYFLLMILLVLIILFIGLNVSGLLENIRNAILWD